MISVLILKTYQQQDEGLQTENYSCDLYFFIWKDN